MTAASVPVIFAPNKILRYLMRMKRLVPEPRALTLNFGIGVVEIKL